jgi:hypothetical protein
MSETAPRSNPRLENFEANKAAAETAEAARHQEAFENEIYGEAGQGDNPANYTDEHLKRIEEADAYERHMEEMAKRPSYEPGSLDEINARVQDMRDLDGAPSRAYDLERDTANEMNEAFDDRIKAEGEALERKLSGDPALRFMDNISREIAELRATKVDEDTDEDAINARIAHLEEVLQQRLERYEASAEFDAAIADYMMDRDDAGVRKTAAEKALADLEVEADKTHIPGEDKVGDDDSTPEVDKVEDDDHTPKADKVDEDDDHVPEVDKVDEDEKEDDKDHIPEEDKVEDDDEDHIPGEDKVGDDDEDGPDHIPGEDKVDEDDDKEDEPGEAEKKKWYKRLGKRLHTFFTYENEDGERKLSGKKLTIATLGLAAVAAAAYFTFRTGTDHSHLVPNGPKGGDAIDAGGVPPVGPEAIVPGADLPPSAGFDYPWNWASEAFGADHAMSSLQDLAAKAVEDGKNVEWHGSGTRQWLEIDGNSNTKQVIDILRQYHK